MTMSENSRSQAKVRVLIQTGDGEESWSTVGVSDNILEASWQALADAINYKLLKSYGGAKATHASHESAGNLPAHIEEAQIWP